MSIENRELFENQERLRATLGETKLLNNDLTKQIMDLRTELREIMAENRITPNFNEGDQSGHSDLINIMV